MGKLLDLKLAFVDTETTGVDESKHELIEIGALIYDPLNDTVVQEWEKKIAPRHVETASPKALEINGYTNNPGLYRGNLKSSLIKFNSLVKDCMIVGQNIDFDLRFLGRGMEEFDIKPSYSRHRKLDIMSIAWPIVHKTDIRGLSLAHFCDHFGVTNVGAHTALADCRRTFGVYKCLMNAHEKATR